MTVKMHRVTSRWWNSKRTKRNIRQQAKNVESNVSPVIPESRKTSYISSLSSERGHTHRHIQASTHTCEHATFLLKMSYVHAAQASYNTRTHMSMQPFYSKRVMCTWHRQATTHACTYPHTHLYTPHTYTHARTHTSITGRRATKIRFKVSFKSILLILKINFQTQCTGIKLPWTLNNSTRTNWFYPAPPSPAKKTNKN